MNKKTAFGATAAAAALVVVGAAAPAMAADYDYSSLTKSSSRTTTTHVEPTTVLAPNVDVLGGDILGGNSVGSGNSVDAPLLSGNETAVGNGNETALGNVSGNDVSTGDVSTGDINSDVSDLVDNATDLSVSDFVDVNDILGDVGGWVDVSGIFED